GHGARVITLKVITAAKSELAVERGNCTVRLLKCLPDYLLRGRCLRKQLSGDAHSHVRGHASRRRMRVLLVARHKPCHSVSNHHHEPLLKARVFALFLWSRYRIPGQ